MLARSLASLVLVVLAAAVAFAVINASTDSASGPVVATSADPATDPEPATSEAAADEPVAEDAVEAAAVEVAIEAPPVLGEAAELRNLDGWLQSDVSSLGELDGTVRVVQFWTFGCYNCKNTLPNLIELNERHANDNFEIVGVHAPEFDYEADPANIERAAADLGVTWPIALDTEKTNFRSWQESRRFWPRTYVLDQNGDIRFDRIGEGAYDKLNETVAFLLDNPPEASVG